VSKKLAFVFSVLMMASLQASLAAPLASSAEVEPLAPPAEIAPYIKNDHFSPGNYQWLRGAFRDASEGEVAGYRKIMAWRQSCRADDLKRTRSELSSLGISFGSSLDSMPYRTLKCGQLSTLPEPINLDDWSGFKRDVAIVRPIVEGYLAAIALSEKSGYMDDPDIRFALTARVMAEQTLRAGLDWPPDQSVRNDVQETLTPQQNGILVAQLAIALQERDQDNTAWLKAIVRQHGWPKRSEFGDKVTKMAWLLAQHADAAPSFQVLALRLMEPLVATGEANKNDYAFLFDRVMLKLIGKQRYGTQLTCEQGKLVPLPLQEEAGLESRRHKMGIGSLADYEARTLREAGPC
jgi:hypothetical protein